MMGRLAELVKNTEGLKIAIMSYEDTNLEIICMSNKYYSEHLQLLKRPKERKKISEREFHERLWGYLWNEKVSQLLIILYLEELRGVNPTIWELNKLLKRTSKQYSATFKQVSKLEKLDIVHTKDVASSPRKEKEVFINKKIVTVYGDDEFRKMMLEDWDGDAKAYIEMKLRGLLEEKEEFERKIERVRDGKRGKNKKGAMKDGRVRGT